MADQTEAQVWTSLWRTLDALARDAGRLRRLSQEAPLRQARPDYPQPPRPARSYAAELREVLDAIPVAIAEVRRAMEAALPGDGALPPPPDGEAPDAVRTRLDVLERAAEALKVEAFEPPPPLPRHAPPYLLDSPRSALAGSKAVLLSDGIEEAVAAIRNGLLARANAAAGRG